jgi:hypothetical protein
MFEDQYIIKNKLLKYAIFGGGSKDYKFAQILKDSVMGRRIKKFKGYTETEPNDEGKFLFTYFVRKAFDINREYEGYESFTHFEMAKCLERDAPNEVSDAIKEIKNIYHHVQDKMDREEIRLKRVLPIREVFNEGKLNHEVNILSSYTWENSNGDYGVNHDRILKRNVRKEEILIHPDYIDDFVGGAEQEFVIINFNSDHGHVIYDDLHDCTIEKK